ncbi:MAG: polysaccharide biosynthesis C-terminal domain-containing protein [Planctomyces sp.]|nr:polysaccharide biosynthesis C-terminal domain-containing protein [Planctomyces sp.]
MLSAALRRLSIALASPTGRALALTGLVTVCGKFIGLGRELLVASRYGAAPVLDAYLVALSIPTLIYSSLAGALGAALIPQLLVIRRTEGPAAEIAAQQRAMGWGILLLAAGGFAGAAAGPWLLDGLSPGFDESTRALTLRLLWMSSPYTVIAGVAHLWGLLSNTEGRFGLVAAGPAVLSLTAIGALLVDQGPLIARPLVVGVMLGSLLELVINLVQLSRTRYRALPRWARPGALEWQLAGRLWPAFLATLMYAGIQLVDRAMASLLGPGVVSEMNYGNRFVAMVMSLVMLTVLRVAFPHLSRLAAAEQPGEFGRWLKRYGLILAAVAMPFTIGLCAGSFEIVRLTFERGRLTSEVAERVALIQGLCAVQLPFFLLSTLLARAGQALQMNRVVLAMSAGTLAANSLLNVWLMGPLGAPGIALATAAAYLLGTLGLGAVVAVELRTRRRRAEAADASDASQASRRAA